MLANALITNSNTTVFTASGNTAVITMFFCNTSNTNNALLSVYAVKSGESPSSVNQLINNQELFVRETYVFNSEKMIIAVGDSIVAVASPSGDISSTISFLQLP